MAASTITRESMTNGVTVWNVARIGSAIYDRIDAMFAGAITFGGVINSEGFGTHVISAGGTGGNILRVRNTTDGTGNYGGVQVGNDAAADFGLLAAYASSHSTLGDYVSLETSSAASGLWLRALGASGVIKFGTGSSGTERMEIGSTGVVNVKSAADGLSGGFRVTRNDGSYFILNMDDGGASTAWATLQAGDGSAYRPIQMNPNGGGVHFADGSASEPSVAFASDTNTGLYRVSADIVAVAAGGAAVMKYENASGSYYVTMSGQSSGNNGPTLTIERTSASTGAPGILSLYDKSGTRYYLWVDSTGDLRVGTTAPSVLGGDTGGTVVGTQS